MTGHEFVIEGRPNIQVSDDYWEKEYETQRKDRIQDCIDNYLQDGKVDARRAYEEILSCIDDVINYHKKQFDKAVALKSLMMGNREVDFSQIPDRY